MITMTVRVNADAPVGTLGRIRDGLEVGRVGPVRQGLVDSVDRLDSHIIRRFDRLSMSGGGGEWKPLAPSTVRGRLSTGRGVIQTRRSRAAAARTGGLANVARVLYEKGDLRRSLDITGKNHVRQSIPNGIRTGSKDPKIAFHQFGTDRVPARPVYVPPPAQTARAMAEDVAVGIRKMMEAAAAAAAHSPS